LILLKGTALISSESYENVKIALREILSLISQLKEIEIDGVIYEIIQYLGDDVKFLALMLGINPAMPKFSCIWCKEYNLYF
jgi:hypothetical protein